MVTNFDLFYQKNLKEQEYILKYFYLIDTDGLIRSLSEKLNTSNIHDNESDICSSKVDALFQTVFEEIFTYAYRYVNFISTETFAHSFFGEPYYPAENNHSERSSIYLTFQNYAQLQKLALYNFCISEGFFYFLEQDYFSKDTDSFSPLKAIYKNFFNMGFFSKKKYSKDKSERIEAGSFLLQNFYNLNCKIRKADHDTLFYFIMNQLCFDTFRNNKNIFKNTPKPSDFADSYEHLKDEEMKKRIYIPHIYKFPVYTYSDITSIHSLDRNLLKNPTGNRYTLTNYRKLYKDIIDAGEQADFDSLVDTYLFQTLNERYFGFSTFSYITDTLNNIFNSESSELAELRSYKKSSFDWVLKNLSTCPLIYSRNFFLFYALEALKYSKSPETKYLKFTSENVIKRSVESKDLNELLLQSKKLELIVSYFSTLNQITLPILSALWKIVLSHFEENFLSNKLSDYFENYITNHFDLLTTDFTELLDNFKVRCVKVKEKEKEKELFVNRFTGSWIDFVKRVETLCKTAHNKEIDSNENCSTKTGDNENGNSENGGTENEHKEPTPTENNSIENNLATIKDMKKPNVPYYSDKFQNAPNTVLTQEILHDFLLAPCHKKSRTDTYHFYSYISEEKAAEAASNSETNITELNNFQHGQVKNIFNLFS